MRALWIENQQLSLKHDVEPTSAPNGVMVTTRLAGICGTDLELLRGYYDFSGVPGHEFVAEVTDGRRKGERVVADINLGCGLCSFCSANLHKHCLNRRVIGINNHSGAFAEQVIVPEQNLVSIPDAVPDWQAVQLEPLAAALQLLEHLNEVPQSILLVGYGRLGRMVSRVLDLKRRQSNLVIYRRGDVQPDQSSFDVTIDCSGSAEGLSVALASVKARGKLIVKSTYSTQPVVDMSRIVVDEVQLIGSRCGSMEEALKLMQTGELELTENNLAYYPLEAFDQAFRAATSHSSVEKVLFQF